MVYADPYFSETLVVQNEEDSFTYHYTVTRLADDEPWKLQRAWRTDKKGFPAEEFPLP